MDADSPQGRLQSEGSSPFRKPPSPPPVARQVPTSGKPREMVAQRAGEQGLPPAVLWGAVGVLLSIVIGAVAGLMAFSLSLLAVAVVALVVARASRRPGPTMYCPHCGVTGVPRTVVKGSTLAEILLWLAGLLPGLIYSIWRLNSRHEACPSCHQAGMIPADSPRAREMRADAPGGERK